MIVVVVNIVDGVGGWMVGIGNGMEWDVGATLGRKRREQRDDAQGTDAEWHRR